MSALRRTARLEIPSIEPPRTLRRFASLQAKVDRFCVIAHRTADDPELANIGGRIEHGAACLALIHEYTTAHTTQEVVELATMLRIPSLRSATARTSHDGSLRRARSVRQEPRRGFLNHACRTASRSSDAALHRCALARSTRARDSQRTGTAVDPRPRSPRRMRHWPCGRRVAAGRGARRRMTPFGPVRKRPTRSPVRRRCDPRRIGATTRWHALGAVRPRQGPVVGVGTHVPLGQRGQAFDHARSHARRRPGAAATAHRAIGCARRELLATRDGAVRPHLGRRARVEPAPGDGAHASVRPRWAVARSRRVRADDGTDFGHGVAHGIRRHRAHERERPVRSIGRAPLGIQRARRAGVRERTGRHSHRIDNGETALNAAANRSSSFPRTIACCRATATTTTASPCRVPTKWPIDPRAPWAPSRCVSRLTRNGRRWST